MELENEQIEKIKTCKSLQELKELAKAEGIELTEEEALFAFNSTHSHELSDDELSMLSGGCKKPVPKYNFGAWVRIRVPDPGPDPRIHEGRVWGRKYERRRWIYDVRRPGEWRRFVEESQLILIQK